MQHLFVLSVLLAIASIAAVVLKLGADKATTISLHAVKHPAAYIALACGLSASVVLNIFFLFGWMQDTKQPSAATTIMYCLLMLSILVTSWIPDTTGWKRKLHRGAAYSIVIAIPLLLVSLLPSSASSAVTAVIVLAVLVQCYLLYLFFKVKSAQRHFLLYQAAYLVLFFVAMGFYIYTQKY